jgi:four helix bundle protein
MAFASNQSLITKNSMCTGSNCSLLPGRPFFSSRLSQSPVPHRRELLDQLDRACLSILLNTAEGNGKRHGLQRAKFFDDAGGSALQCAACLDASVAKPMAKSDRTHSETPSISLRSG